jgi:Ulp1 family protease
LHNCSPCVKTTFHPLNKNVAAPTNSVLTDIITNEINDLNFNTAVSKSGFDICYHDLFSTRNQNWFNDNIIDFYLFLISSFFGAVKIYSFPSSMFSKFTSNLSLSFKKSKLDSFGNYNFFLIPTIYEKHWRLVIVDILKREITFYDSLNWSGSRYFDLVLAMLCIILKIDLVTLNNGWCIKKVVKPSQHNDYDCGAFICFFARNFFLNSTAIFSQNQISDFREHILNEILATELISFDGLTLNKTPL